MRRLGGLVAALLLLALSACGDPNALRGDRALDALAGALIASEEAGSVSFTMRFSTEGMGTGTDMRAEGAADFDAKTGHLRFTMITPDLSAIDPSEMKESERLQKVYENDPLKAQKAFSEIYGDAPMREITNSLIVADGFSYSKSDGFPFSGEAPAWPGEGKWSKSETSAEDWPVQDVSQITSELMQRFREYITDVHAESSTEEIDGEPAIHYRGSFDLIEAIKEHSGTKESQPSLASMNIKPAQVDVWVQDDRIRRARFEMNAGLLGSMHVQLELFNYGEEVVVSIPPDDEIYDHEAEMERMQREFDAQHLYVDDAEIGTEVRGHFGSSGSHAGIKQAPAPSIRVHRGTVVRSREKRD